jgi:hypothetical protein
MSVVKDVTFGEKLKLQVRADTSNVLNSAIWDNPGTNLSNPTTFGVITTTSAARKILLGARLTF